MEKLFSMVKLFYQPIKKLVTKVYHSHLVTGAKSYRESTIVSGVSKCIGSVLENFHEKKKWKKSKVKQIQKEIEMKNLFFLVKLFYQPIKNR
jgi:hypothetical protein